jgi:drug/metabolite transporter (DMT)-like permease
VPLLNQKGKTWTSLWAVYLIWGSTYFAIAKVIESMPPLLGMGVRFTIAGALLSALVLVRGGLIEFKIPLPEIRSAALLGFITLGMGIGTVSISQAHVPSGVVSLIIAALPLWIALFRTFSGDRLAKASWLGTIIGFIGVVLLLKPGGIESVSGEDSTSVLLFFMLLVLFGNISWALGTFLAPRFPIPKNSFLFTAIEMFAGGISLTIAGLLRGEEISDLLDASAESWFWFWYLVLIGSIVAYSAYLWLVMNAPVSLTATYAYVNPVIAVALGALFLGEIITLNYAIGGLIILAGVLIVVTTENRRRVTT